MPKNLQDQNLRRPSSLVRYHHGGFNSVFPIAVDGLPYHAQSHDSPANEAPRINNQNNQPAQIVNFSKSKKKISRSLLKEKS